MSSQLPCKSHQKLPKKKKQLGKNRANVECVLLWRLKVEQVVGSEKEKKTIYKASRLFGLHMGFQLSRNLCLNSLFKHVIIYVVIVE